MILPTAKARASLGKRPRRQGGIISPSVHGNVRGELKEPRLSWRDHRKLIALAIAGGTEHCHDAQPLPGKYKKGQQNDHTELLIQMAGVDSVCGKLKELEAATGPLQRTFGGLGWLAPHGGYSRATFTRRSLI
jgi:hypothetical protein